MTPFPFCTAGATINPWAPPATIVNPPAGLLSSINGVPVFSDITLCCGSNLNFVWTVSVPSFVTCSRPFLEDVACPLLRFTTSNTVPLRFLPPHHQLVCESGELPMVSTHIETQSNGNHGVWQLASGACPATFVDNPTLGQRQLFPVDPAVTSAALTLNTPGTFWFTSQADADCANGELYCCIVLCTAANPPAPQLSRRKAMPHIQSNVTKRAQTTRIKLLGHVTAGCV